MNNIQYDPERILNGFKEDVLIELAKKLKRKIRQTKSDIIQDILAPPKGKAEDIGKVWQEINWQLRKDLEVFSRETFTGDIPPEEQFKVGYMFTLSSNSEIRAMGEKAYCQAIEIQKLGKELEKEKEKETVEVIAEIISEMKFGEAKEMIEATEAKETKDTAVRASEQKMLTGEPVEVETKELQKKIRTLENKLRKANEESLRTKEQLEKLKIEMRTLKSQWGREKEETGKYRNRVRELEGERTEKEKEIELLKQKLEQGKTLASPKIMEQPQHKELSQVKDKHRDEIDLAAYQGRKALIFAERDNEVDSRLNALGIIPIWAMEIDWNRPRRRMSTCEIVLYKRNDEKLKKLDEIRDVARCWNIPCNELSNF